MRNETKRTRQAVNLRPLTELNLIEDFLTNQMITHPVVGMKFSKRVLTTILGREIGTLSIAAQKAYPGENTDRHGIRLDVCLDEQGGDIVDLEPDRTAVQRMSRRCRGGYASTTRRSTQQSCPRDGVQRTQERSRDLYHNIRSVRLEPHGLHDI